MTTDEILVTLQEIFRRVLRRPGIELREDMSAKDVDGWDSLSNMVIISEIEKTFGIRFPFREIVRMRDVGDLCRSVAAKIE